MPGMEFLSHRDNITLGHHSVVVIMEEMLFAVGKLQYYVLKNSQEFEVSLQDTILALQIPTMLWWAKLK